MDQHSRTSQTVRPCWRSDVLSEIRPSVDPLTFALAEQVARTARHADNRSDSTRRRASSAEARAAVRPRQVRPGCASRAGGRHPAGRFVPWQARMRRAGRLGSTGPSSRWASIASTCSGPQWVTLRSTSSSSGWAAASSRFRPAAGRACVDMEDRIDAAVPAASERSPHAPLPLTGAHTSP